MPKGLAATETLELTLAFAASDIPKVGPSAFPGASAALVRAILPPGRSFLPMAAAAEVYWHHANKRRCAIGLEKRACVDVVDCTAFLLQDSRRPH